MLACSWASPGPVVGSRGQGEAVHVHVSPLGLRAAPCAGSLPAVPPLFVPLPPPLSPLPRPGAGRCCAGLGAASTRGGRPPPCPLACWLVVFVRCLVVFWCCWWCWWVLVALVWLVVGVSCSSCGLARCLLVLPVCVRCGGGASRVACRGFGMAGRLHVFLLPWLSPQER